MRSSTKFVPSMARIVLVGLCLVLASVSGLKAQQQNSVSRPATISYQGQLVDTSLKPVPDGIYTLTVTFRDLDNRDSVLWTDDFVTNLKNGIYNIAVGSQKPLPPPNSMDKTILFSVSINGGTELQPGEYLSAVPMAINVVDGAITTKKIADLAITSDKLADSSITSAKMNADYVSSISVNGQRVTGKGSDLNI